MEQASILKRIIAKLIDLTLIWAIYLFLLMLVFSQSKITAFLDQIVYSIIVVIYLPIVLPFINSILTSIFGGSLGKLLTGIKIINKEGQKISFSKALFRQFIGYKVSAMGLGLGFIWAVLDKNNQTWHDKISNTFVTSIHKLGLLTGLISLTLLTAVNIYILSNSIQQFGKHKKIYGQTIQSLWKEISSLKTQEGIYKKDLVPQETLKI